MLKYTKYLLSSISRKKAPYIIIAIFFLIFDVTTWISTREINKAFQSNINSLSTFDKFFPFLFSTLFIAMIVIYAFKQGETDGSELMVVAKPISRIQIIFGKFFALYIYIFSFSVLSSVNYLLIAFVDEYANISDKIAYALSLGVGGFIVLIIISSILVILASVLKRTSLLSFGVVLSAIIPILSFTISPIGKGQPFGYDFTSSNVNQLKIDKLKDINKLKEILDSPKDQVNLKDLSRIFSPETIYVDASVIYEAEHKKYEDQMWYKNVAFADIWYQWGRFYSMFQNHKKTPSMIAKWYRTTKLVTSNSDDAITITNNPADTSDDEQYVLYVKTSALLKSNAYLHLLNQIALYIATHKAEFNELSLFDRLNFIESVLREYQVNGNIDWNSSGPIRITKTEPQDFEQKLTYAGSISATMYALLTELDKKVEKDPLTLKIDNLRTITINDIFDDPKSAYPQTIDIQTNSDGIDTYGSQNKVLLSPRMARVGSKIYVYQGKDFIKSNTTIIVWISLAILFLGGAIVAFIKRDFK